MDLWSSILNWLPDFWHFQLIVIDNRPITLGKVLTGMALLVMGYFITRSLSREIEKKLLSRLDLEASLRASLKTVIFYFLLSLLTLFVLRLLNVPLTIFTVLGGALALGVGFGSQNIVNNFISGLILMVERPVRVGDLVEVEGLYGTVEHIGARSTRIKSVDNTHIVVPNSSFLEKNVLNWTLSDNVIRSRVDVGVAYGSPTRDVEKILIQVASDEKKVLRYPEPKVIFANFGSDSLEFELYFWTQVTSMTELRLLASSIRFEIDHAFKEAGIVIAFPQRDVHFDTQKPLQVQIMK